MIPSIAVSNTVRRRICRPFAVGHSGLCCTSNLAWRCSCWIRIRIRRVRTIQKWNRHPFRCRA